MKWRKNNNIEIKKRKKKRTNERNVHWGPKIRPHLPVHLNVVVLFFFLSFSSFISVIRARSRTEQAGTQCRQSSFTRCATWCFLKSESQQKNQVKHLSGEVRWSCWGEFCCFFFLSHFTSSHRHRFDETAMIWLEGTIDVEVAIWGWYFIVKKDKARGLNCWIEVKVMECTLETANICSQCKNQTPSSAAMILRFDIDIEAIGFKLKLSTNIIGLIKGAHMNSLLTSNCARHFKIISKYMCSSPLDSEGTVGWLVSYNGLT